MLLTEIPPLHPAVSMFSFEVSTLNSHMAPELFQAGLPPKVAQDLGKGMLLN